MILYNMQLNSIAKRDKALIAERSAREQGSKQKRKKDGSCLTTALITIFVLIVPSFLLMLIRGQISTSFFGNLGYLFNIRFAKSIWMDLLVILITLFPFIGVLRKKNVLPGKKVVAPAFGSLAAVVISMIRWRINLFIS